MPKSDDQAMSHLDRLSVNTMTLYTVDYLDKAYIEGKK